MEIISTYLTLWLPCHLKWSDGSLARESNIKIVSKRERDSQVVFIDIQSVKDLNIWCYVPSNSTIKCVPPVVRTAR